MLTNTYTHVCVFVCIWYYIGIIYISGTLSIPIIRFFLLINTLIQQGHIKLIKSDSHLIYQLYEIHA